MPELFIGLMSGTSLDGVDAVVADCGGTPRLVAASHFPFPSALRGELMALQSPDGNELHRAALAANALAHVYADGVRGLLADARLEPAAVRAIGCHGQTIRHQPDAGYTLQLVNGALLAELAGIDVVCDFRSRDVAAGGQGAPLAPAFHRAVFSSPAAHRVVVNIGGIANITDLPAAGGVTGFDCGPGNLLLDAWIGRHLGAAYDAEGAWGASGELDAALLERMFTHGYFSRPPPKSTGRETFSLAWLDTLLTGNERAVDVQRTLAALTAHGIAAGIVTHCGGAGEIYLCGGGARNAALVQEIGARLPGRALAATDTLGIAAEHVEALAFAWLASQRVHGKYGNLPAVSGARGERILGALHRA
jgi:anhydro-N-acetylmuramic acid kinase